jgi:hypothetical protein
MNNRMIKVGLTGLYWVGEQIIKERKTAKELINLVSHIPESEHQFLEDLHALFHKEEKPSKKKEGGE